MTAITSRGWITPRVSWSGILAGILAGIAVHVALTVLGLALGLVSVEANGTDALGGVAIGTAIWMAVSMGVAAYVAGLTAARASGGLTPAQGRFNGLLTGMALVAISTLFAADLFFRGLNSALGLAGSAVNTVAGATSTVTSGGGLNGALQTLGLDDEYRAISNGLSRDELTQIVADAAPELSQQQVAATVTTVESVIRNAGRTIGNDLGDVNDIGGLVNRQVTAVTQALSGEQFASRLEQRGLSRTQARQVVSAIGGRVDEIRTQVNQAAQAISARADELSRAAAGAASKVAWLWLIMAGLVIGLATLGGGVGHDLEPIPDSNPDRLEPTRT